MPWAAIHVVSSLSVAMPFVADHLLQDVEDDLRVLACVEEESEDRLLHEGDRVMRRVRLHGKEIVVGQGRPEVRGSPRDHGLPSEHHAEYSARATSQSAPSTCGLRLEKGTQAPSLTYLSVWIQYDHVLLLS